MGGLFISCLATSPLSASGTWKTDLGEEWITGTQTGAGIDYFNQWGSICTRRNVGEEFSFTGGNLDPLERPWAYLGSGGHYERTVVADKIRLIADTNTPDYWPMLTTSPRVFQAIEGNFTVESEFTFYATAGEDGNSMLYVQKDANNLYQVGIKYVNGMGKVFMCSHIVNGVFAQTFYQVALNVPFKVKIVKSGTSIRGYYLRGAWLPGYSINVDWPQMAVGVCLRGRQAVASRVDIEYIRFSATRTASAGAGYISKVIDLGIVPSANGSFSWTRSMYAGAAVDLFTRTSLDGSIWSDWSGAYSNPLGEAIASPFGRYFQYKADFTENPAMESCRLDSVTITYPGIPPFAPVISSSDFNDGSWGSADPVNLYWTQPADNPAPVFAYYYAVDALPVSAGVLTPSANIMSATVFGSALYGLLEGGHEYYLVAQGDPAEYPLSPVKKFRILKDTVLPGSVAIVSPTHPTLDESPNDAPVFNLLATDTETTTDYISGISAYYYEFSQDSGMVPSAVSPSSTAAQVSFTGVADGTWWFQVRARDGAGNFGPASGYPVKISFKGQVKVAISSPTHPEGVESGSNSPEFKLTLSNPDSATIVGYHYRLDQSPATAVTSADSFTKSEIVRINLLADGAWYLHAAAKNSTGTLTNTDHYGFTVKFNGKVLEAKNVHAVPSPIRGGKALIRYELMAPSRGISAEVLDGNGHRLATLNGTFVPGKNEMTWDCSSIANGVYYLRLKVQRMDGKTETIIKKIAVVK